MGTKAFKYKIEVSEGVIAFAHGMTNLINEVFIPELHCWINEEGIWYKENYDRMVEAKEESISEMEIPDEDIVIIENYIEALKSSDMIINKYSK